MGAAASALSNEIPDRVDLMTIDRLTRKFGLKVDIDMVRFDVLKDRDGTVSRRDALQLIENKLPPIYSLNALCVWPSSAFNIDVEESGTWTLWSCYSFCMLWYCLYILMLNVVFICSVLGCFHNVVFNWILQSLNGWAQLFFFASLKHFWRINSELHLQSQKQPKNYSKANIK